MITRKTFIAIVLSLVSALLFASTANAYISDVSIGSWPGPMNLEIGGDARQVNIGVTALGTSSEVAQINYYLSESSSLTSNCNQRVHLKKVNVNISPGHNYNLITTLTIPETHPNATPGGNIYQYAPYEYILVVVTVGPFDTNTLACDENDNYQYFGGAKVIKAIPVTLTGGKYSCYQNSLSGTGDSQVQPDGTWFYHGASGTYSGDLTGPNGIDFDLFLYKWEGSGWTLVSYSALNTSNESINYTGSSGYYLWLVNSYNGSGNYNLCVILP